MSAIRAIRTTIAAWLLATTCLAAAPAADDDDDGGDALRLTPAQVEAIGLRVAAPVAAAPPRRIAAYGRVLDSAQPIAAFAAADGQRAAERAARLERDRLRGLHADGAAAALRRVEAAEAELAAAQAARAVADAALVAQWTPLARLDETARQALLARLRDGRSVLVRADLPGRQRLAVLPERAQVRVDGVEHAAQLLGALRNGQTALPALLLELALDGLGAGVPLAVTLDGEPLAGFLLPQAALLYDEHGAHVYCEEDAAGAADRRYRRRAVELLMPAGEAYLVRGVDADDRIVVHGLGLLWSMQGGPVTDDDD
ncbi:MAG TPA: hypothetical protein VMR06_05765 [Dokdonella sp.]|uniref:hypothetical protein n=1 Tax=Dokdonella sp. TaxID=2291710 RepID=UPI002CB71111|nr:hypothetical protein [Dokdonella sp.]HUD41491.1 hypothetical protein [Dokdonella sp.]